MFKIAKKAFVFVLSLMLVCGFSIQTSSANAADKTQKGYAIKGKTRSDKLKVVKNQNFFVPKYTYKYSAKFKSTKSYERVRNTIVASNGNYTDITFKTQAFLPNTYKKPGDWGNTQSMIVTDDYWYTLTVVSPTSNTGWITRYDLKALAEDGIDVVNATGLDKLRKIGAANKQISGDVKNYKKLSDLVADSVDSGYRVEASKKLDECQAAKNKYGNNTTPAQAPTCQINEKGYPDKGVTADWYLRQNNKAKEIAAQNIIDITKNAMKIGKKFETGHGQAFALNPKTNEIWLCKDTEATRKPNVYTEMLRIDQNTLLPNASISFRMGKTIARGNNLAFDSKGNAYWYNIANPSFNNYKTKWMNKGGINDKSYVKFYKGKITTSKVTFKMVMQGLRYRPGSMVQSLSYNPANNRLYVISDGSITSVPASKLGKLKPKDVLSTTFKTKREFETIQFDKEGYGYLMVHLGPEILKSTTPQVNK